ncbi:MAG: PA2779 family protein [Syntrophobacterales bacterium]|nr:MAG: PA2779 family protein [Syntrophobacterales bacterium]
MFFFKRFCFRRVFIWYLTVAFSILSFASSAPAMFIPSPYEGNGTPHQETDLQKIQRLLESKLVQHKLSQLGLTKEEIEARLNHLDDEQIHQIASQINALEPGGGTVEVVIIVILVALLGFLILELTGTIDVLKW